MLIPSYSQLMDKMNTVTEDNENLTNTPITSRYTIVLAVAKRARQLIDGSKPLAKAPSDRAVSIAVKEMDEGKIKVEMEPNAIDATYERLLASQSKFKPIVADDLQDTSVFENDEAYIDSDEEDYISEIRPETTINSDDDNEDDVVKSDQDLYKKGFVETTGDEFIYKDEEEDDASLFDALDNIQSMPEIDDIE
ncbi:MAG: DNA-directed RNA polymerase subunit omega [Firmicutes bacterium]|nr:DNA-directed RNA polymerase subunit omega [Bacillota bacterium]